MKLLEDFRAKMGRDPNSYEELVGPVQTLYFMRKVMKFDTHIMAGLIGASEEEIKLAEKHKLNLNFDYAEKMAVYTMNTPATKEEKDKLEKTLFSLWIGNKEVEVSEKQTKVIKQQFELKSYLAYMQLTYNLSIDPTYHVLTQKEFETDEICLKYIIKLANSIINKIKISAHKHEIERLKALKTSQLPSLN